jgi:hypothetical protein
MFLTGVISAQERPRIFITDSQAWSAVFSFGIVTGTGVLAAGSSPQTVEVIDDFAKHCPAVTVTSNKDNADYIVLFDRDGAGKAKTNLARADKIAVFSKNGDLVFSGKTRSVANSVKDACVALRNSAPFAMSLIERRHHEGNSEERGDQDDHDALHRWGVR